MVKYPLDILVVLLVFMASCNAATSTESLDNIYSRMSEAYRHLDVKIVQNLYYDSSYYLSPNKNVGVCFGKKEFIKKF